MEISPSCLLITIWTYGGGSRAGVGLALEVAVVDAVPAELVASVQYELVVTGRVPGLDGLSGERSVLGDGVESEETLVPLGR